MNPAKKRIIKILIAFAFMFIVGNYNAYSQINTSSEVINVKSFGAKGNGVDDDSNAINQAIINAKKMIDSNIKKNVDPLKYILYLPSGVYKVNKTLIIPKLLDVKGDANQSIIKIDNPKIGGIIMLATMENQNIEPFEYSQISDLVILGPDFKKNPFAWKNFNRTNPESFGIKILGPKNRIINCTIDGFLWCGIEINSSCYNYITHCYIKNNRIGTYIHSNSTSSYINNSEYRTNSIGVLISNSYANFINNNILEANIANYLDADKSESETIFLTMGKGIMLDNSDMNFINNNCFEQQFINLGFNNSNNNNVSDNFFAIGKLMPYANSSQVLCKFFKVSYNNSILNNRVINTEATVESFNILINESNKDHSNNKISFNSDKDNERIKQKLNQKYLNSKILPKIGM